ncbi:hypothetical protein UFOVP75_158 [uncultured Caudovirales phage]|uniref:Uncharacterized protein n=1 Tax=uncultured Caudovirales phage TaxID=2100421 RepID=A0A6J5KZ69_9CAUD|nr:hypothetical protein UFOVP75_158 [uncultured Caudovirales phage]
MAFVARARTKDTSTTTSTGNFTLSGTAPSGFLAFATVMSTNDLCPYMIVNRSANEWEEGIGKLTASTTLQRLAVTRSSNSDALVNFSAGTKDVFHTATAGAVESTNFALFGDGSDGDITFSGNTSFTVDKSFKNVVINSGVAVNCSRFRMLVSETLDLTNASANAFFCAATGAGGNASGATAGAAGSAIGSGTLGGSTAGGIGGAGAPAGTGATGAAPAAVTADYGGATLAGGVGGNSGATTGGTGGAAPAAAGAFQPFGLMTYHFLKGVSLITGGVGGPGGGAGAGDGTNAGGGGGGGGAGGAWLGIWARVVLTSGSTAAGAISSIGPNGGNGANGVGGTAAGGGGGSGGSGGVIWFVFEAKAGATVTDLLKADGGSGGNGGNGVSTGKGGASGASGSGGEIIAFNVGTTAVTRVHGSTSGPAVASVTTSTSTGATGPSGGQARFTL